jgi:hypothetical protein
VEGRQPAQRLAHEYVTGVCVRAVLVCSQAYVGIGLSVCVCVCVSVCI